MTQIKRLQNIASVLRKEQTDFMELTQAIEEYEALIHEVSDIEYGNESNRSDIHFNNGKALGTTWAALCIKDLIRTKIFIKGLFEAIESIRKTKSRSLHILYAGTGPYATLILPVMASYSEEIVQFTLLEVNEVSLASVRRVIDQLGFNKYIKAIINEDATKYTIPKKDHVDIVLSETMQRALELEQQVPIAMNIVRQVNDDVILIPEEIRLEVGLLNLSELQSGQSSNNEAFCVRLGSFFKLNLDTIRAYNSVIGKERNNIHFPEKSILLPAESQNECNTLAVLTEIQAFGENRILINESGLTTPLILQEFRSLDYGCTLNIHYKVDEAPGIEYRLMKK